MADSIQIKIETVTEKLDQIEKATGELLKLKTAAVGISEIAKTGIVFGFAEDLAKKALEAIEPLHQLREAIEMGHSLANLSARTGETVGNLVVLQQAFKNAGIDAGGVGMVINKLQKAMTGVNEEGMPTAHSFSALGVSVEELKTQNATEQIETLSKAFSGMKNPADRARAAMEMFGRGGGEMLALLSKADSIEKARSQVGGLAETMEANAEHFHELGASLDAIGIRATQLFAGMAAVVAPEMQKIADGLNSIDLTELGKAAGGVAAAFVDVAKVVTPLAIAIGVNLVGADIAAGAATSGLTAALGRAALAAKGFFASLGPIGWTILAASAAIEVFQKVMGDWNEKLDKASTVVADHGESVGYVAGAYNDLATATAAADEAVANTKSTIEATTAALDVQIDSIRNLAREKAALADANAKLAIAKIDKDEQDGTITKEEADTRRRAVKQSSSDEKFGAEQGGRKSELDTLRGGIDSAQKERDLQSQRAEYAQSLVGTGKASDTTMTNLASAREEWKKAQGEGDPAYSEASKNLSSWLGRYKSEKDDANAVLKASADGEAAKLDLRKKAVDDAIVKYNKQAPAIQQAYDTQEKIRPINQQAASIEEQNAQAKAAAEKAKAEKEKADKLKAFQDDLAISNAEAGGDKELAMKLKWTRDRDKLAKELEGLGDANAWSDANQKTNADLLKGKPDQQKNLEKSVVSAMHAVGTGRGEVYAAQDKSLTEIKKTNGLLTEIKGKMKDGSNLSVFAP